MNKELLIKGLIFASGVSMGSLATWKLVKIKYEQIADEEIESMREYYGQKYNPVKDEEKTENEVGDESTPTFQEMRGRVKELEKNMEEGDEDDMCKPYVIKPEESWEQEYPTITLTFFEKDKVLADESNKIISNVDELVGKDFADHFGEYEDDSVYVRNDRLGVYYEILRDTGSYTEYMGID